jgi:Rrf2 family transcriptional regulator, cysteine metabolism repressor
VVRLAMLGPRQFVQAKGIADQEKLPNKFLESILLSLRRGGFLESKVGSGGGYRLSRAPGGILVGDIIRRLEGRMQVKNVESAPDGQPGQTAIFLINQRLTDATDDALSEMTIEELMEQVNKASNPHQAMYYI